MAIDISNLSKEQIMVGLRWFVKMTAPDRWNLNHREAATLLNVEESKYVEMLCDVDDIEDLSLESIERLSLLLGIWKRSNLWAPTGREDIALLAFTKVGGFKELEGKSVKQYLLDGNGVEKFYEVEWILRV